MKSPPVRVHSLGIISLLLATLFQTPGCNDNTAKNAAPPPPPEVEVVTVCQRDVPIYTEWVASIDGYVNAQIQPQVTGYLIKQTYLEGKFVRQGEVLFEIDPRPFQAALEQTQGDFEQAKAQLAKAELDVQRDTPLAKERAIPQAQLDNDIQARAAAKAMVEAKQAQVDQAKLNLGFTKVRSLVDGIAGIAKAQIGDLVGSTSVLTTVSQINPVKAYFALSESEYFFAAKVINEIARGQRTVLTGTKPLQLILSDGTVYPSKGWWVIADRQVDLRTGTMRVAGAFENPQGILRPGQFGRIRALTHVRKDALVVPQRAVVETQGTYSLVTVGPDSKASIRPVTVGERVDSDWVITAGLKPGDRVIVEGIQKAREGAPVNPKPYVASQSAAAAAGLN